MNHAAVTHHLLRTSCTGRIDLPPHTHTHPTTTPTTIHKMSYSGDGASGFCGWPTSWMTERPGWLSCRMASSAFYDCKSLHVMGIRSRKLEGKKGGRRDEKGDGKRNAF